MGDLFWLDYTIIAAIGLLVVLVFYFSIRDSRKRKSAGCSGGCGACSYSCDARLEPQKGSEVKDADKQKTNCVK
ncbi:MAG: FeoB-associated Cys-rich membrane protein [Oscillospiraceae bacterium]|nr:FeoB-associated Cys-rich membrane protein [Oscillospiraceae bacterium]